MHGCERERGEKDGRELESEREEGLCSAERGGELITCMSV